jgi:hypothetical protein
MKLAERRFWTWISVAALTLFARGGAGIHAQEKSTDNKLAPVTQLKHNVTPGPNSKLTTQTKRGVPTGKFAETDAGSKDAATMTTRVKTSRTDKTSPELKTNSMEGVNKGSDVANGKHFPKVNSPSSSTKSKHHGLKRSQ